MSWRDHVTFRVEIAAGFYAADSIGGEWDVAQWDNANEPVEGRWEYKSQVRPPQPGEIHVVDNDPDPDLDGMFIHKTDNDGVDRSEALGEVSPPPQFTLTDNEGTWAVYDVTATRDMGDWFDYDITKAGGSELDLDQNSIVLVEWSTGDAVWGGATRAWKDVYCDLISAKPKTGRAKFGAHYRTGSMQVKLSNSDGRYSPSAPISELLNVTPGKSIRIVADIQDATYAVFTGTIIEALDYDNPGKAPYVSILVAGPLRSLARVDRVALANPVGGGELSGARMHRILDTAGWPADMRVIGPGVETLQATTLAGNTITEAYLTADSEGGELFGDTAGRIVFLDRTQREALEDAPPAFTVAGYPQPDGNSDVWVCWAAFTPSNSLDRVVNYASVARVGGTAAVTINQASINSGIGAATFVRTNFLNETDMWPIELSQSVVAARSYPVERVVSVSLTDGSPEAAVAVLAAGLGSPIRIRRFSGPWEFDMVALIQGVKHTITPTKWQVDLATDQAYTTDISRRSS